MRRLACQKCQRFLSHSPMQADTNNGTQRKLEVDCRLQRVILNATGLIILLIRPVFDSIEVFLLRHPQFLDFNEPPSEEVTYTVPDWR